MGIKKIINKTSILYTLYSVFAVLFFVWFLFPSDYFADFIEKSIHAYGQGAEVEIETVGPAFPAGLKLKDITIKTPEAGSVPIDYISAGLDFFSLIKLQPVISLSGGLFGGTVSGKVSVPDRDSKNYSVDSIKVKDIDLSTGSGMFKQFLSGVGITGFVNAEGSYAAAGRGHGNLSLVIEQLKIQPEKPLLTLKSLTFKEITAQIDFKSKRMQIENCEIDGDEFDGSIKGSVIIKYPYNKSVLRLSGKFRPEKEFAEKMPLELLFKKKVKYGDEVPFKISGTINKPRFR